jgi:hypothetical protein
MTEKYPASDHSPLIKGYPGGLVAPETAYLGCRVHPDSLYRLTKPESLSEMSYTLVGFNDGVPVVADSEGNVWVRPNTSDPLVIAPGNHPSPIGRDECGVRRSDGGIDRVAMFDGSHALVLEWCVDPTGGSGWEPVRDGPWVEVSRLRARYATVGTFAECESWIAEQEQPKPRYVAVPESTSDANVSLIRVRDRVAGGFLTASRVESYLNAAELETEGGE